MQQTTCTHRRLEHAGGTHTDRRLLSAARARVRILLAVVGGVFAVAIGAPDGAVAAWNQPVAGGLNVDSTHGALFPKITTVGGVPYVAWSEWNAGYNRIVVKRLVAGAWSRVGADLNVSANAGNKPSITEVAGVPYVAWSESDGTTIQIYVKRLSGSAWVQVGTALNVNAGGVARDAGPPRIASIGGVPYVTWAESNGTASQIYVKQLSGTAWSLVGTGSLNANSTKNGSDPTIASVGGDPYVAWSEPGTAGITANVLQVYVAHFTAGAWSLVGGLNVDGTKDGSNPTIASVAGVPYVAWDEANSSSVGQVYVKRYSGGDWVSVGSSLNVNAGGSQTASRPSITDVGGVPFVAWHEPTKASSSYFQVYVKQFDGAGWNSVGSALNVNQGGNQYAVNPSITSVGGVPYVTWTEQTGQDPVYVKRLEPDFLSQSSSVTDTGALLITKVRDYGVALPISFEYGTTASFGTQTAVQTTAGTGSDTVAQNISGLSPSTGYSWRAFGTDGTVQTALSPTQTFTTMARATGGGVTAPTVVTGDASAITGTSATLRATVNPGGAETSYYFEYGTDTSYGKSTPTYSAGSGSADSSVNGEVVNLQPNTTYHFRAVALSAVKTVRGTDAMFTTGAPPPPTVTVHATFDPTRDAGRFDLLVDSTVVKAAAGDGDSGSGQAQAGTVTVSEVGMAGSVLSDYTVKHNCVRNGFSQIAYGPGASVGLSAAPGDVIQCTFVNSRIPYVVVHPTPHVTVTAETITSQGSGPCDPTHCLFPRGTGVLLTMHPDPGYWYSGWRGCIPEDGYGSATPFTFTAYCSDTNPNGNVPGGSYDVFGYVTAMHKLTVALTGPGSADYAVNPGGAISSTSCGGGCLVADGTTLTITARPDTPQAKLAWGGDCASATGLTCTLSYIYGDKSVTAAFGDMHVVNFGTVIGLGKVHGVTQDALGSCDATTCTVSPGGFATLTATPDAGQAFAAWDTGGLPGCANQQPVCKLGPVSSSGVVHAMFSTAVATGPSSLPTTGTGTPVSLACVNVNGCDGTVTIVIAPGAPKKATDAAAKRPITIGTASFHIKGKQRATVIVKLNAAGRRELAKHHRLQILEVISVKIGGRTIVTKRPVSLVLRRR